MCSERDVRGDGGFALIASLLVVVIVSAVVAVLVGNALGELRSTGQHRDAEVAVFAAEAAADVMAERVAAAAAGPTPTDYTTGHTWPFAGTPTAAQERDWARAQLASALTASPAPASLLTLPGPTCGPTGTCLPVRALGIRPTGPSGALPFAYGVAAAPGEPTARARVVRLAILTTTTGGTTIGYQPGYALLTGGYLEVDAEMTVSGAAGNVHTNSTLEVKKTSTASGNVTAVGTFLGPNLMTVPVGRTKAGGQPAVTIPVFSAATYYDRRFEVPAADWYDLCPDGRAHARSTGAPCSGAIVPTPAGLRAAGGRWEMHQTTVTDGVYYVHQQNFTITGNTGNGAAVRPRVTVIASSAVACSTGGSIDTDGDAWLEPYMADGTLFIAERQARLRRRATLGTSARPAFIGAVGDVRTDNDPVVVGAVIARNTCAGIINDIKGKPVITYAGTLQLGFGGTTTPGTTTVQIGRWEEL